jgi:hypothetical protein
MSRHSMIGRARPAPRAALVRLAIVLTATVCLGLPASAAAAGTLDQQQTTVTTSGGIFGPQTFTPRSDAQTFTAGLTGGLDRVDLFLKQNSIFGSSNSVGLTVEIRTVSGGVPGAVVLASATIAPGAIPAPNSPQAFVPVTFSPPAPVVAGTQYAIVAYTGGADRYAWGAASPDPYAGGAFFQSEASPPTTWTANSFFDFAFKTYVVTDQGDQDDQGDDDSQG